MKRRALGCLIIANLALIWGNSLMTGTDSGNFSGAVVEFLSRIIPTLSGEAGHTFIRKLAHFSEFACLGLLVAAYLRPRITCWTPGFGLLAACIDETIQIFVPGRASSLIDVWIDAVGFCTGLGLLLLGYNLIKHFWRTKQ